MLILHRTFLNIYIKCFKLYTSYVFHIYIGKEDTVQLFLICSTHGPNYTSHVFKYIHCMLLIYTSEKMTRYNFFLIYSTYSVNYTSVITGIVYEKGHRLMARMVDVSM